MFEIIWNDHHSEQIIIDENDKDLDRLLDYISNFKNTNGKYIFNISNELKKEIEYFADDSDLEFCFEYDIRDKNYEHYPICDDINVYYFNNDGYKFDAQITK